MIRNVDMRHLGLWKLKKEVLEVPVLILNAMIFTFVLYLQVLMEKQIMAHVKYVRITHTGYKAYSKMPVLVASDMVMSFPVYISSFSKSEN